MTEQITKQGKKNLETELNYLKTIKRAQIAERIRIARDFGDISENAEYEAAKNEQGLNEGRISEIEYTLENCIVIDTDNLSGDTVASGTEVTFSCVSNDPNLHGKVYTMKIVGQKETCPQEGRMSTDCPIALALNDHKVGDVVDVRSPIGVLRWKIEHIEVPKDYKEDKNKENEQAE